MGAGCSRSSAESPTANKYKTKPTDGDSNKHGSKQSKHRGSQQDLQAQQRGSQHNLQQAMTLQQQQQQQSAQQLQQQQQLQMQMQNSPHLGATPGGVVDVTIPGQPTRGSPERWATPAPSPAHQAEYGYGGQPPPPPPDDDAMSSSSVGSQDPRTWISSRSSRLRRRKQRGSKHSSSSSSHNRNQGPRDYSNPSGLSNL
jgi:hypothetical protein